MPIKYVDENIVEKVIFRLEYLAELVKKADHISLKPELLLITASGIQLEINKLADILKRQLTDNKIGASCP